MMTVTLSHSITGLDEYLIVMKPPTQRSRVGDNTRVEAWSPDILHSHWSDARVARCEVSIQGINANFALRELEPQYCVLQNRHFTLASYNLFGTMLFSISAYGRPNYVGS